MVALIRHLVAIAVLPFTVTVLIPVWLSRRSDVRFAAGATASEIAIQIAGVVFLAIGLLLFTASLRHFITQGKGTLAPWDPPKKLVVSGPYRYVRNPMISGVLFIVFGEALVLRSWPHGQWALLFLVINLLYIPLLEEPMLRVRFGSAYDVYRQHVWMFIPRLRPYVVQNDSRLQDQTGGRENGRTGGNFG
jgi:protein-S-isoprenylcysteine O-methyltransferase Ste14